MSTLVILNLGSGDLLNGFPQVSVRIWTTGSSLPEQSVGSLPPAPQLIELYQTWQSNYRCLCGSQLLRSAILAEEEDDLLEIDEVGITNVSENNLDGVSHQLCIELNTWLSARGFLKIERHMRSQLHPTEEIRIILETDNDLLRHLPWHKWDIFQDYRKANIALSQSDYKCRQSQYTQILRNKIRILAILGNSRNIDVEAEREFLQNLPNAETTFLVNPDRQELNTELWSPMGWDILFFAGHSQTDAKTGRLYINENPTSNSITIEKLEEALKASLERGLILTIFNSCDGLGLASALEKLYIPAVVVMREPVPNRVAQEFLRYFLEAFALDKLSFNRAMRRSCRKLQGLEEDFPGASWLPISCQNPTIEMPKWSELDGLLHQSLQTNLELDTNTNNPILAPKSVRERSPELESDAEAMVTEETNSQPASVVPEPKLASIISQESEITEALICEYEQALAEIIGPIATFLIRDTLASCPQISQEKLIETLSAEIFDPQKATEFKQRFIDST